MEHPGFFQKAGPLDPKIICEKHSLDLPSSEQSQKEPKTAIEDVASLADAGPTDLTFFENKKLLEAFKNSKAGFCLVSKQYADQAPATMTCLVTDKAHKIFVDAIDLIYPSASRPDSSATSTNLIDETAIIEEGAIIQPGAIIGKEVRIGKGTIICSGAVIGYRTYIGRECTIGPNAVITHSLIGDNITIHAGASIGQDGFGYIMGAGGHKKVPQIGRVIIQDKVEIGANTTIDRGALTDTIIGEGTKIDNLVQIGHNVVIGCHAVIVSQTGISGSAKLGNYVVMGGQTGAVGHIEIGDGAQIAASSNVHKSVPAKARYGGTPAKPMKQWFKEIIAVEKLVEARDSKLKK